MKFTMKGIRTVTNNQKNARADLSVAERERRVGLAKLIGQVELIVKESGELDGFDSTEWFNGWITRPALALGGCKPAELLDPSEGREAVSKLLAQMQSGAIA